MFHLNCVHVAGTITRDIEVKYTPSGNAVCQIGLAVNRVYKVNDEKREETTFLDAEAWGKTAEIIGEHCAKGHTIYIQGRIKQESWDDKQTGQKRSKLKIVIEEFKFVSKPRDQQEPQSRPTQQQRQQPAAKPKPPHDPDLDISDDDIPFRSILDIASPVLALFRWVREKALLQMRFTEAPFGIL